MTMNFRSIKDLLITLIGDAAAGRYRVVGFQEQSKGANETLNNDRLAEVYFSDGDFPKSGGSLNGPTKHNITYSVILTATKSVSMDLAVLDNPSSTPVQRQVVLVAAKEATNAADDSLDEFIEIIYQVLMDARNQDLGMPDYAVSNRWVDNVRKNKPIDRGNLVTIAAAVELTCSVDEQVVGDSADVVDHPTIDTVVDQIGDDVEKTGVIVVSGT